MYFNIQKPDYSIRPEILKKIDNKIKPPGSLGMLEMIAERAALIGSTLNPEVKNPAIILFAADHGVMEEQVSLFPQEVTAQMVRSYLSGKAGVNVFSRLNGVSLKIVDAGIKSDISPIPGLISARISSGTKNFSRQSAMTKEECTRAMIKGAEIVQETCLEGSNTVAFGEMGIGNTTSAAALFAKISGLPAEKCVGPGSGVVNSAYERKLQAVKRGLQLHENKQTPLEILSALGGFEIAMIVGAMLKAAELKILIVIDGFIITSALAAACRFNPLVREYCLFAHLSDERAHELMLDYLGAKPILSLGMRLGEATGAALAIPVISAACAFMREMGSFESEGVAERLQQ